MKKELKSVVCLLLAVLTVFMLSACGSAAQKDDLWEKAIYTEDTQLGNGKTAVQIEVKAKDKSVTITVKTDKEILGDALIENGIIDGEDGEYGYYVKSVNGITADYDTDKSFWGFYKDGEMMMTGVDGEKIADGEHYEFVYSK